ncbi:hypothetical protein [Nocardioides sp. SR21]|uniref:hypothetical protein n=1 Tax=Nocardioides sp. SR21 TaxID=2919501 RepID=UPI001FAA8984|nr:hypothetical protein [Nocardioides sp. SR21]
MFDHNCTACAKRQLIFPSQITAMDTTAAGILVRFTCWCGADQSMLTGKASTTTSKVVLAA